MTTMAQGLTIGSTSKPWTIGHKLGSGACGAVHELLPPPNSKHSSSTYAIKLTSLPKARPANGKKRKKTAEEKNADLIYHEHLILQTLGPDVRGRLVPDIPFKGSPPACGDLDGYRFLVMDRMAAPLQEVVPILHDSHLKASSISKVPLGDVAVAMLDCIHAVHAARYVFIDVKCDNFMLAPVKASKKSSVAERVRLIDFGLVESFDDPSSCSHRADEGSALVGTPTYASINVMSGHTASRRDDLEALGYVLSELILNLASTRNSNVGNNDNLLPWGNAKSDNELLLIKKKEMDVTKRSKSKLFSLLKACGSDVVMSNYFDAVMTLKYSATPNYESLRCYLKKLTVTVHSNNGKTESKKSVTKSPVRKSPLRRTIRQVKRDESDPDDNAAVLEPELDRKPPAKSPKKQKVGAEKPGSRRCSTRSQINTSREIATQTDSKDTLVVENTREKEVVNMDWERIPSDENEPPLAAAVHPKACLQLEIVEGPYEGRVIPIGGHPNNTIAVGKNPKENSTKYAFCVSLPLDNSTSPLHAKLMLTSKKTVHSIKVTDMSSTNGTFVNGTALAKGKSKQAFPGDKIKIGDSVFKIKRC